MLRAPIFVPVIWPKLLERQRAEIIGARYVAVSGRLQKEAGVTHVVAERVDDLSADLRLLETIDSAEYGGGQSTDLATAIDTASNLMARIAPHLERGA